VAEGIAAGAVERAIYNGTAAVLVGAVMLGLLADLHPLAFVLGLAATVAGLAVAVRLWRTRERQPRRGADRPPSESGPAASTRTLHIAAVREAVRDLWRERRSVLPAVAIFCLLQHALLVVEAFLMLRALGAEPTLWTVLVFEAVTKIVNTAGMFVPGRLGVSEGGSALLASALGFAASHGLSLALMRRVRALIWAAVGLALLPQQEARARRAR
jgi:hypothetical protein